MVFKTFINPGRTVGNLISLTHSISDLLDIKKSMV